MGIEKALGLKLQMQTDFTQGVREAVQGLNQVADGIERIKNVGGRITMPGLDDLAAGVRNLNDRVDTASSRVNAFGDAVSTSASKVRSKKKDLDDLSKSANNVASETQNAAQAVLRLGTSMTKLGDTVVVVDKMGTALTDFTAKAVQAKRAVDDLDASLLRLAAAQERLALGAGAPEPQRFTTNLPYGREPMVTPQYVPAFIPLPNSGPRLALPPNYESNYGPIPQPAYRNYDNAIPLGGSTYYEPQMALPPGGSTGGAYAYEARPGVTPSFGGTGGLPPSFWSNVGGGFYNFFGPGMAGWGKGLTRYGNDLQSMGYAGAVNAAMIGGVMIPAVMGGANIEDLQYRNREAIVSAGGSNAQADRFNQSAMDTAVATGANFQQTVGGVYDFVSASPQNLMAKYGSDPGVQQALEQAYKRVAMMQVAGSSSQHQISMEEASLDVNNVIENLGFDTSTPAKYAQAVKDATNILINLKNRTSTQVDLAASSFRAVGPISSDLGLNSDELVGFVAAMAQGKIRGAPAGQGYKRLLLRESIPPKKLKEMQDYIRTVSGGRDSIDLFDSKGNPRSIASVGADLVDFEDRNHLDAGTRAKIEGTMSGLYAFPQLGLFLKSIRQFGGKKGFEKYGESFRTGKVNGEDATVGSFHERTKGNTQNAMDRTYNDILRERQKIFKEMEPEILQVLKTVEGLVNWFDKWPPGLQKAVVGGTALLGIISGLSGAGMILFGNLGKLIGGIMQFGGIAIQIGKVVSTGEKVAKLGPIFNGLAIAIRAVGLALFTNPIGLIITGIVAVSALLYFAWTRDWGGIREKTHTAINAIGSGLKALGSGIAWFFNSAKDWFGKFAPYLRLGLDAAFPIFGIFDPKFREAGLKLITMAADGIKNAAHFVVDEVKHIGSQIMDAVKGWWSAGVSAATNFAQGIKSNTGKVVDATKQMAQKGRDVLPGSEPKDSSSPYTDLARSGRAVVTNFTEGIQQATPGAVQVAMASAQQIRDGIENIVHPSLGGKKKKGKAAPTDTIIDLKPGETVAHIEKQAKIIEAALERAGTILHKKWITLVSGTDATRVYGDAFAYRKAATNDGHHDTLILQQARDYEARLKRFPQSFEQQLKTLSNLLIQSASAHTQAVLDGMIGTLIAKHQKALEKYTKEVATIAFGAHGNGGEIVRINNELATAAAKTKEFADVQQQYNDKLQMQIDKRKNQELPTLRELISEYNIEVEAKKKLSSLIEAEQKQYDKIMGQINDLIERGSKLNDNDAQQAALKKQLAQQIQALYAQSQQLNGVMIQQTQIVTQLTGAVNQYSQAISDATNKSKTWSDLLSSAFKKAGQDALKSLGDAISNGIDKMMENVFGAKRKGIAGFIGSFFADAFSTALNTVWGKVQNQLQVELNNSIGNIFGNLFHLGKASSGSKSPTQVQITDGNGTEIGKDIHDATVKTAQNTVGIGANKVMKPGDSSSDPSQNNDPIDTAIQKALKSKLGKTLEGIGGAIASYEEATAPGANPVNKVMGALGTYSSITSIPGFGQTPVGQGVAVAAALFTLFSHSDNPAQMPDKYDTARYTQFVGEMTGSASTAYGPAYNGATDPIQQQLGGKPMLQYIEDWIKANINSPDKATKALAQSLLAQYGDTGNGQLAFDHNIGQETVIGGSLHGSYVDLHNAAEDAVTSIKKLGDAAAQGALSQQESADRLASSFTSLILGGPAGFSIPALVGGMLGGSGGGASTGGGITTLPGSIMPPNDGVGGPRLLPLPHPIHKQPPVIHILEGANITTQNGAEVIAQIRAMIPEIRDQINYENYQESRLYGDYISAVS